MKSKIQDLMAMCVLACAVAGARAATVTNVKGGDADAIFDTAVWGISAFSAADDYRIGTGLLNTYASGTFEGNSLIVATRLSVQPGNEVEFPREGLRFMGDSQWNFRTGSAGKDEEATITGTKITIDDSATSAKSVWLTATKAAGYGGTFNVKAPLYANDAKYIRTKWYNSSASYAGWVRLRLFGDQTNFKGRIVVQDEQQHRVALAEGCDMSGDGRVILSGNGILEQEGNAKLGNFFCESARSEVHFKAEGALEITSFNLSYDVTLKYVPSGTGTNRVQRGYLKVQNAINTQGHRLNLACSYAALANSATEVAGLGRVVKLVESVGTDALSLGDFTIAYLDDSESGIPVTGDAAMVLSADGKTLYALAPPPFITQIESDSSSVKHDGKCSSLAQGIGVYKWSDGLDQHADGNYIIPSGHQLMVSYDGDFSKTFLGSSLTLMSNAIFTFSGSPFNMGTAQLNLGAGTTVNAYTTMGVLQSGTVKLTGAAGTYVTFDPAASDCGFTFTGGFSGDASMRFRSGFKAKDSTMRVVLGESPDFRGVMEVMPAADLWDQRSTAIQSKFVIEVASALALGGPMAKTNVDSFILYGNQTLRVTETTSFDEPTRGLAFKSISNNAPCYFCVDEGKTATVNQSLRFYGELDKTGAGTLAVGGTSRVLFAGTTDDLTPCEGSNVLVIAEGALKPMTTNALDGLAITFKAGTKLVLQADTDNAPMRAYGLYDAKWAKPISLDAGMEVLDVVFDCAEGYQLPTTDETIAICTVPTEWNALTTESFRLGDISGRHGSVTVRFDSVTGTKTFVADFRTAGTSVIIR